MKEELLLSELFCIIFYFVSSMFCICFAYVLCTVRFYEYVLMALSYKILKLKILILWYEIVVM